MLRIAAIVASALLALGTERSLAVQEWQGEPARLGVVEGEILVQASEMAAWAPAPSNTPLGPGDRVWVAGRGRAELQLPAGNVVRLGDETRLEIRALPRGDRPETRLGLERGSAVFYVRADDPDNRAFAVDVPQASLQASLPARFRTDLLADGTTQVSVQSGEVTVQSAAGSLPVRGQQTLRLSPGTAPEFLAGLPPDEFDRWNALREQQLARPPEPPHVPTRLASYASDFASYGHWVWVPDYGHVWVPVVPAGWTPFRFGRWIWWRDDFVWVADEPWGWVPFHYGRWYFHLVVGWVWVPPAETVVVWHPAVVGWIHGPDFVAWCPLAPGEVFVGHNFYGPGTVSITNVNVTNIWVTNVFVNARVKSAIRITNRDAFAATLMGRRVKSALGPAKDLVLNRERVTIGPPSPPAAVGVGVVKRGTAAATAAHGRPVLGFVAPPPTAEGAGSAARSETGLQRPGTGAFAVPPAGQPAPAAGGIRGLASPPLGPRSGVTHGPGPAAIGSAAVSPAAVGPVNRGSTALPQSVPSSGVVLSPQGPGRNAGPVMTGGQRQTGVVGSAVRGQGVAPLGVTPPASGGLGRAKSP